MKVLTETELRARLKNGPVGVLRLEPGIRLSPAAEQFVRDWQIRVERLPAPAPAAGGKTKELPKPRTYRLPSGEVTAAKPEHYTHLVGDNLVPKSHPRMDFRGKLDVFQAHLIEAQVMANQGRLQTLVSDLGEVLDLARQIMRSDALDQDLGEIKLFGLGDQEIRIESHSRWLEVTFLHGHLLAKLNLARGYARETELAGVRCYLAEDGSVVRPNILRALNRLSSALYILVLRCESGFYRPSAGGRGGR